MKKILVIIKREYITRVAKRSFLLMTLLIPLLIFGFYALIIVIAISGSSEKQNVAVIDKGSLFTAKSRDSDNIKFTLLTDTALDPGIAGYSKLGYTSLLYVPPINIDSPKGIVIYSESQIGPVIKSKIEKVVNGEIESRRMAAANISPEKFRSIQADINIPPIIGKGKDMKKGSSELSSVIGYTAGILIYITMFIYGMMVMRGVMEEKINRIAEVIVSSVKPFQLMLGKILGIGAVGLTQFIIWIVLVFFLQFLIPVLFPGLAHEMAAQAAQNSNQSGGGLFAVVAGLKSLPFGLILLAFIFYFIGGYLLYSSLFAAVGSVVSEDQQEAQQLTLPITMPIVLAFVIMTKAAAEPESGLALFGSLFPLTSPIVMMGRIGYGVPWWQMALSMAFLILGFLFTTWLAGKIYRTGILLYGKKVTWKEMVKWAFRKS
jgi:ABC-2 type transport system permease protein